MAIGPPPDLADGHLLRALFPNEPVTSRNGRYAFFKEELLNKFAPQLGEKKFFHCRAFHALHRWAERLHGKRHLKEGNQFFNQNDSSIPSFHFIVLCLDPDRFKVRRCSTCYWPLLIQHKGEKADSIICGCNLSAALDLHMFTWLKHCPRCLHYFPRGDKELRYHFTTMHAEGDIFPLLLSQRKEPEKGNWVDLVRIVKSRHYQRRHPLQVVNYRSYHASYMSSFGVEAFATTITGQTTATLLAKSKREGTDLVDITGGTLLGQALEECKPSFFVTLKFNTLVCYAHDCLLLSGKSVVVFNNQRVMADHAEAEKMALIYANGRGRGGEPNDRNPHFYLQFEEQVYRDVNTNNIGFVAKERLGRSVRTIAANPPYVDHARLVVLVQDLIREAFGKLRQYDRLPFGFSVLDMVEVFAQLETESNVRLGVVGAIMLVYKGGDDQLQYFTKGQESTPIWSALLRYSDGLTCEAAKAGLLKVAMTMIVLVIAGVEHFEAYEADCKTGQLPPLLEFLSVRKLVKYAESNFVQRAHSWLTKYKQHTLEDFDKVCTAFLEFNALTWHPHTLSRPGFDEAFCLYQMRKAYVGEERPGDTTTSLVQAANRTVATIHAQFADPEVHEAMVSSWQTVVLKSYMNILRH